MIRLQKNKKISMQKTYLKDSFYLERIKALLKADFVGWVTQGQDKFLRVKVGKNDHLVPLIGKEVNEATYNDLISKILSPNEDRK